MVPWQCGVFFCLHGRWDGRQKKNAMDFKACVVVVHVIGGGSLTGSSQHLTILEINMPPSTFDHYRTGNQNATLDVRPLQVWRATYDLGRATVTGHRTRVPDQACPPSVLATDRLLDGKRVPITIFACALLQKNVALRTNTHLVFHFIGPSVRAVVGQPTTVEHLVCPCVFQPFSFSLSLSFLSSLFFLSLSFLFSSSHSSPPPLLYSFPSPPRLLLGCKAQGGHCLCLVRQGFVCRVLIILFKCIDRLCVLLRPCG